MGEAALLGTWDEKMVGDRDIISQIADMPYKEWVSILRNELHATDSIFSQDGKFLRAPHLLENMELVYLMKI